MIVRALVATGINAYRPPGDRLLDILSGEDGAGRLAFLRSGSPAGRRYMGLDILVKARPDTGTDTTREEVRTPQALNA